jgi:hypothetical protein
MSIRRKLIQFVVAGAILLVVGVSAVGASGPVGSDFLINSETHDQVSPAIAYNPERQEYLVVWFNDRPQQDDVYAQRVAWNGRLLGPRFAVAWGAGVECRDPDVVYNPTRKQYLVVWRQWDGMGTHERIWGQRLWDTGQPEGPKIPISDPDPKDCLEPAVAYALVADRYLVVWESKVSGKWARDMEGQALSTTGALVGSDVMIAQGTSQYNQFRPDVAYNRSRNEYLVVWERWDATTAQTAVYGRRVQGSGTPMGAGAFAIDAHPDNVGWAAVAAIPTEPNQGRYLVAWEQWDSSASASDVYAQRLKGDGSADSIPFRLTTSSLHDSDVAVAGSEAAQQFLAVWIQWGGVAPMRYGRTVPLVGNALGPQSLLGGVSGPSGGMGDARAGRLGDFLVAYWDKDPVSASLAIYGRLWGTWVHLPLVIRRR